MTNQIEWRPLDVMAAEGMSLRVGSFKASDGEVVEFTPDVLRKVFAKVRNPVPMYLTHAHAETGKQREVLGHAVKLGLEADGDKIHYKAIMMDPSFKLMYAAGYDDTSAEIQPIRDEAGVIIDGVLTGIAVVPNPAITGTQMKVSAIAFEAPAPEVVKQSSGGIKLTGKRIESVLLEAGLAADKVGPVVEAMETFFSKKFEQSAAAKEFETTKKSLELACSERDQHKKMYEDVAAELDAVLGDKVASLVNDIMGMNFANPEQVVDGLSAKQKIVTLSKIRDGLVAAKPAVQASVGLQAPPGANPADPLAMLQANITEMGLQHMWDETHKPVGG